MGRSVRLLSGFVAGALAFVVGSPTAYALSSAQYKCQTTIAKEGGKYFTGKLKLLQKCRDANLAAPNTCTSVDTTKLVDKLNAGLDKACSIGVSQLKGMGFPGPCPDPNTANGFTTDDLKACILESHDKILEGECDGGTNRGQVCTLVSDCPDSGPGTACRSILTTEYDPTVSGPLLGTTLKCQKEVAKNGAKVAKTVLSSVQKCRNALLNCKTDSTTFVITCKLSGLSAASCATNDEKTAAAITKARDKANAAISSKCSDADAATLKLCEPDQNTGSAAATCEVDAHQAFIDDPDPANLYDLIDYEYAASGVCGDNQVNQNSEECDGIDDSACPGQCGAPLGLFSCLCQNVPRSQIVEHSNADLDNGWTGQSHDSGIVEGGGYVTDLWDCDGPGGPDTICVTGPSCALAPHQSCSLGKDTFGNADSLCPGVGNYCRVTPGGSQGPHCAIDYKKRCRPTANDCVAPDRCVVTPHGAPLPLVSGGVSVCVVNQFTEDVVGTTNLATGDSSVRLRQNSLTYQGGSTQQPCPVCGGFCSGNAQGSGPGTRNLCSSDADCGIGSHCITEAICSWGPNIDKPCRANTPFGGPTEYFGNPSVDCPVPPTGLSLLGTIDIFFNPATTGPTSLTANLPCNTPGFNNKICVGGPNQYHTCTVDSECPSGTCNNQCFCPNGGGEIGQKPNGCNNACLGGANDSAPCTDDSECDPPNGFCHVADCRVNPSDTGSAQEGLCTTGPDDGRCSLHPFKGCITNTDCTPGGGCPFCSPGETCTPVRRQCFVNPTIVRQGFPGVPDRTTAATFCLSQTNQAAVNSVAGLSGPGAITNPTTVTNVGF